ncbi:unnamed protein product [Closterium sp. Naga37s-1]|nr:unnamed protein product [Closterium sp. Naga37s-1]
MCKRNLRAFCPPHVRLLLHPPHPTPFPRPSPLPPLSPLPPHSLFLSMFRSVRLGSADSRSAASIELQHANTGERIQDLLRPSSSNMQIRESENGVYISGVEEVEVTCVEDCLKLLAVGERNRTVAFTKMNAHSSRSHAIAIITVEKKRRKEAESSDSEAHSGPATATAGHGSDEHRKPEKKDNISTPPPFPSLTLPTTLPTHSPSSHSTHLPPTLLLPSVHLCSTAYLREPRILVGKLFLVDLAGSERLKKSGACVGATLRSPPFPALSCPPSASLCPPLSSFETFHNPFPLGKPRLPAFPCAPALPLTAILSGHISQPSDGCLLVLTTILVSSSVAGKCINARADPHAHHVPFRDSKLTRLLQESLGGKNRDSNLTPLHDLVDPTTGNAKTSLIINVAPTVHHLNESLSSTPFPLPPSPSPPQLPCNAKTSLVINVAPTVHHLNESLSSLLFGSRAMEVKTKAMVNEEEEYRILTRTLHETATERPCVTLLSASRSLPLLPSPAPFPCSLPLFSTPALCPPLCLHHQAMEVKTKAMVNEEEYRILTRTFHETAMEVKTKAMVNEEEEYRILTRTLQETIDEHDDRVHSLEVVVYSQEEQLSQAKASLEEQKELVETLQAEREEMEQKLADGVAAVEEEWAAKALQAEREEMEQKLAERVVQWKRSGLPSELAKGGMVRMWLEQAEAEATQRMEEAQQTFTEEGAGDAGQELMAEEASKESDSGEKGNEGGLVDGEGSGDGEEEGSEDWEDGSEVKELLGAFTSVALTHVQVCHPPSSPRSLSHTFSCPVCHPYLACVLPLCGVAFSHCYYRLQNLSKATECLTMERDDMAKELASAREMVQRLEQQLREAQEAKGQQEEALLVASESGDVVQRLEQQLREAQEEKGHLEEALLIASESGDVVQRLEQQLREAQEEKGHLEEALLIASESGDVVQRLEQQLREAQEEKGHLEEALLIASESGDGADGTGAGLQLLMTEKAARQQAEQEVAALRGEMSRGRVKLEETEKKLAQQIEETTQRVEQVRALKAESKRLNELVVATSRALVAGAADAPGRALSSLDYHFCAPKIKT